MKIFYLIIFFLFLFIGNVFFLNFVYGENSNLKVIIGKEEPPIIPPDDDDDEDDEDDDDDKKDVEEETFQLDERRYYSNLTTEKEIESDDLGGVSNLDKKDYFDKKNILKEDDGLSQILDQEEIFSKKSNKFWWWILGILFLGILGYVLNKLSFFSAVGLFFQKWWFVFFNRTKNWGIVFNFETKMPISNVRIKLYNSLGVFKKETFSDGDGFYNFFVNDGTYFIEIDEEDYFLKNDISKDEKFGNIYRSDFFKVKNGQIFSVLNLALVNKEF